MFYYFDIKNFVFDIFVGFGWGLNFNLMIATKLYSKKIMKIFYW
jgi:hypothetical protein